MQQLALAPTACCSAACTRPQRRRALVAAAGTGGDAPAAAAAAPLSRRQLQAAALAAVALLVQAPAAQAAERAVSKRMKNKIAEEDYKELPAEPRLRYYELLVGSGPEVKEGSRVTVHFTCKYRGLSVVSTLSARVLGGNRTVAEPFTFSAGQPVSGPNTKMVESAGGLFAGGGGIKPPAALSESVVGMRAGGKRSLLVPPELGYGAAGEQEIPPNCPSFELQVELLSVE